METPQQGRVQIYSGSTNVHLAVAHKTSLRLWQVRSTFSGTPVMKTASLQLLISMVTKHGVTLHFNTLQCTYLTVTADSSQARTKAPRSPALPSLDSSSVILSRADWSFQQLLRIRIKSSETRQNGFKPFLLWQMYKIRFIRNDSKVKIKKCTEQTKKTKHQEPVN